MKYDIAYFYVLLIVLVLPLATLGDSYIAFLPLSQESNHRIYFQTSSGILKNMFDIADMIPEWTSRYFLFYQYIFVSVMNLLFGQFYAHHCKIFRPLNLVYGK